MKKKSIFLIFAVCFIFLSTLSVFSQRLIDSFEYANAEESMARIDGFMIEMQNNPNATAYFIIYGGKVNKKGEVDVHIKQLPDYLKLRGFDKDRIIIINGGFREKLSWDFWLVNPGEEPPEPESTVKPKNVKTKGKFRMKNDFHFYICC